MVGWKSAAQISVKFRSDSRISCTLDIILQGKQRLWYSLKPSSSTGLYQGTRKIDAFGAYDFTD